MRRSVLVALILAATVAAGAEQKQAPPAPGPAKDFVIPSPKRFTLSNGLPVTMVPFGLVPKVTIRLVVEAGNVYEAKDQVWLADLTGNMLREGTTALTGEALAREFAAMGGQLGVGVGPDMATISTDVLSDNGVKAVELIADVAERPRLPESELARVKANMARDLAIQKSTPQSVASEKFAELMYGDHPYGRLFPTEAMLSGYTLEQVRAFHKNHFTAGRARIYVAGVFDAAAMEASVRKAFDAWPRGATVAPPAKPAARSGGFALLDRAGAPQSTVMVGLKVADPSHADWVALEVTDSLLGGSFASRITANIREQKGYTYSPFSTLSSHPGDAQWVEDRRRHDQRDRSVAQGDLFRDRSVAERGATCRRAAGHQEQSGGHLRRAECLARRCPQPDCLCGPARARRPVSGDLREARDGSHARRGATDCESIPDAGQDDARDRRGYEDGAGTSRPME